MSNFLTKNKKLISTIMVALILFARCNLGIVYHPAMMYINVLVNAILAAYCGYLVVSGCKNAKIKAVESTQIKTGFDLFPKNILNVALLWLVLFSGMVFIYGHFKLGTCSDFYSRQFVLLTIVPAVFVMIILLANETELLDIVANAGCAVVVTTFITGIIYDSCYTEWFEGTFARVGKTPAGTSVDSANLYMILLVPILYKVLVQKLFKPYVIFAGLGILGILLTGSKACIIPVLLVFAILLLGSSKDKKTLIRSIVILLVLFILVVILCLTVPIFYRIVADRFIELFTTVGDTEFDLHTSTGQRMAVIDAFKKHFGEHPFFGHGFYSFLAMPYSMLEEYKVDGVAMYRNIQIHMNYLELLFSYGIFGFVLYYWLPVKLVIDTFVTKVKENKLICFSYLVSMFFIDMGLDMYYKYLIPYFAYFVVYCFLKCNKKKEM